MPSASFASTTMHDDAPAQFISGGNTTLNFPVGITLDPEGRIYVADGDDSIRIFAADATGDVAPIDSVSGGTFTNAYRVRFAPDGKLWVYQSGNPLQLSIFEPTASGVSTPIREWSAPNHTYPRDFNFDTSGNIVLGDHASSTIYRYPTSSTGNSNVASSTISGGNTGISSPYGVVIADNGEIYVSNEGTNTINVYAADAADNATPIRSIHGALAGLDHCSGLALDDHGNIYVADLLNDAIKVFAPDANGDVEPLFEIAGANTLLDNPYNITLDSENNIYVTSLASNAVIKYNALVTPGDDSDGASETSGSGSEDAAELANTGLLSQSMLTLAAGLVGAGGLTAASVAVARRRRS
jgi:streptogramin lyase